MSVVDVDTAEKQNTAMSQSCDTAIWKSITVLPHDSILDLALEGLEIQIDMKQKNQQCQNGTHASCIGYDIIMTIDIWWKIIKMMSCANNTVILIAL